MSHLVEHPFPVRHMVHLRADEEGTRYVIGINYIAHGVISLCTQSETMDIASRNCRWDLITWLPYKCVSFKTWNEFRTKNSTPAERKCARAKVQAFQQSAMDLGCVPPRSRNNFSYLCSYWRWKKGLEGSVKFTLQLVENAWWVWIFMLALLEFLPAPAS